MRIAIVNSVYSFGSTGKICQELATHFKKSGHSVLCCYGRHRNSPEKRDGYYFSNPLSVQLHGLIGRLFDKSGSGSYFSTKRLIKKLEKYNPDVIVLNNLHGYYLNINLFLKWISLKNIKTICVMHDCWNFTGHCTHFDSIPCYKWKTKCFSCPLKHDYPASILVDNSKANFKMKKNLFSQIKNLTIVCPSEWLAIQIRESFFSSRSIHVIHNGIDTNIFRKSENNFRKKHNLIGKKIILCVASIFDRKKGIDDIIRLNSILTNDEQLVVIGKIKTDTNIPMNILWIERTSDVFELVDAYSSADIFFNPTYQDTYPTVDLEALACGCPVVSYDTGGSAEIVKSDFLVKKGDVQGAYNLIQEILNNKIEYKIKDNLNLSKEKMMNDYLYLVESIFK